MTPTALQTVSKTLPTSLALLLPAPTLPAERSSAEAPAPLQK